MDNIEWAIQYFGADGNGLTYVDPRVEYGFNTKEEAEHYGEELVKNGYTGVDVFPTLNGERYFE